MATNYTCKACSRALLRPTSSLLQSSNPSRNASSHNVLTRSYHATRVLSASAPKPAAFNPDRLKAKADQDTAYNNVPSPRMAGMAKKIREAAPKMTETYAAYGLTEALVKECCKAGDYTVPQVFEPGAEIPTDETGAHVGVGEGWWYETLGLKPTFINWAQITFIHMYMVQVRLRMLPETHAPIYIQHLTNHAFYAAEDRLVIWHQMNASSLRQRHLKDLFAQWRAVLPSYDEALVKGDAWLAAALWRNLFAGKPDVDFNKLAQVVGYMRRELRRLDLARDDEVLEGDWRFGPDPSHEEKLVKLPSRMAVEAPPRPAAAQASIPRKA